MGSLFTLQRTMLHLLMQKMRFIPKNILTGKMLDMNLPHLLILEN
nr:MAG TPA: hypothetical protein [Caudoviricetes sp.]